MKAAKINVEKKTIELVEITDDYRSYYPHLSPHCSLFTCGFTLSHNEGIFVDDEGLLNGTAELGGFAIDTEDGIFPFVGNGLIIGCDEEGESIDIDFRKVCSELSGKLFWLTPQQTMKMAEEFV